MASEHIGTIFGAIFDLDGEEMKLRFITFKHHDVSGAVLLLEVRGGNG